MTPLPRTWVLLGHRRGDNNQLLALAEGLGIPFETRTLRYRDKANFKRGIDRPGTDHLDPVAARWLAPPWPDIVIGIGRRSVPAALWIRDQSGGLARLVRLGHPRVPNELFDLVVTTRQYPVADGTNVVRLPLAMNRFASAPAASAEEGLVLAALPRPLTLVSLGGTAPMWTLDLDVLDWSLRHLAERCRRKGGTLAVISSPRTPPEALALVAKHSSASMLDPALRYPVALAAADEHFVTADSVSMISEAVMTGKPVGLIPVMMDGKGRRQLAGDPGSTPVRDIRRFWIDVKERGLAGTVDAPACGVWTNPVDTAVAAVRARLSGLFP